MMKGGSSNSNNGDNIMTVNMSKLHQSSLKHYAWFYGVPFSFNDDHETIAHACSEHFASKLQVNETVVMKQFVDICQKMGNQSNSRYEARYGGVSSSSANNKRDRSFIGSMENQIGSKKKKFSVVPDGARAVARIGKEQVWILVRVIKFNKRKHEYVLEDADEVAKDTKRYHVAPDYVVALPTADEVSQRKSMPKNARVLARYPKTSAFYLATVAKKCDKTKRIYDYNLRFDGDETTSNGDIRILKVSALEVVEVPSTY